MYHDPRGPCPEVWTLRNQYFKFFGALSFVVLEVGIMVLKSDMHHFDSNMVYRSSITRHLPWGGFLQ
jgi:hypothetical protein